MDGPCQNTSLPARLLAVDDERNYSPVTRAYIKRVTFADESESQFEESIVGNIVGSPFEWHPLSRQDRDILSEIHSALVSYKPEMVRDACIQFRADILEDFPAEVFIQRPEILFALQDVLGINCNPALKDLAAQALVKIGENLMNRWRICQKIKSSKKDHILLMTCNQGGIDQEDETEDEESFADQINTTQLKKLQLLPHEFCLMILSTSALTLQTVSNLRPTNSSIILFEKGLEMLKFVFEGQIRCNKEVEESLQEIENQLFKALIQQNDAESRVVFLQVLKISIKFLTQIGEPNSNLSVLVQKCAFDPTLLLTHPQLHELIEAPRDFCHVFKTLEAFKVAARVLKQDSKLRDLKVSLRALKYHGNYRRFIPMVMQNVKSVRIREEADLSSEILIFLLQNQDSEIASETHFQLHNLVQDILGVGQALDVDGSKKFDLSFLILDQGKIFQELLKTILKYPSLHLKKAAYEIVLYLLKNEDLLGKSLGKILKKEVIEPNWPLIEACAHLDDFGGLFSFVSQKYSQNNLEGNLRILLTSKDLKLKLEAQTNIRSILSREIDSQTKLPRFSTVINVDFVQSKIGLFHLLEELEESLLPEDFKDLLDILHLSPDYDIVSRKKALEDLRLLIKQTGIERLEKFHGFEVLLHLFDKALEEGSNYFDILPELIKCFRSILKINPGAFEDREKIVLGLTRTLYIFHQDEDNFQNIIICLMLILFKDWLQNNSLPCYLAQNIEFPLDISMSFQDENQEEEIPQEAASLLKIFWNTTWFGQHQLMQWNQPKGENSFSKDLFLSEKELKIFQNSNSQAILARLSSSISKSKSHNEFQENLQLALAHLHLIEETDYLPWKAQFSRFLRLKPISRNDEKLFLSIIEFIIKLGHCQEFISEGQENLIDMISRDQVHSGVDLLARGREKVAKLLLQSVNVPLDFKEMLGEKVWENEVNIWSLKTLAKFKISRMDTFKVSRLLRMINEQKPSLFAKSRRVFWALIILKDQIAEEPKMTFQDLEFLKRVLEHRDVSIRILGFQIVSILSCEEEGAKMLLDNDSTTFWSKFIEIVLDRVECFQIKETAMMTLTNLLRLSAKKDALWHGPIVEEKVSGLKMNGEASMRPFLASVKFEESIGRYFRAFSIFHCPKSNQSSEESVRQNSQSSSLMSHHEIFEEPPTASFVASVITFLIQIINMDKEYTKKDRNMTTLPHLKASTFPYILKLPYDIKVSLESGTEDLMNNLCDFFSACLLTQDWTSHVIQNQDCCIGVSMLISIFHRLDLEPSKLLTTLALLLKEEARNEHLSVMIRKYVSALLEMTLKNDREDFCQVFFKYLHDHEPEMSLDRLDSLLVHDLAKKLLDHPAAFSQMLLISSISQEVMLEEVNVLVRVVNGLDKVIFGKTSTNLMLLNNFCFGHKKGQLFLVEQMAIQKKLVNLASKVISQLIISAQDTKRQLVIILCDLLTLLTTLISDCNEAKIALSANVGIEKGKASCLLQILIEIITDATLGDHLIRSKIWIPNVFRIITACLTSVECRSWIIRSHKFLNSKCIRDLDQVNPDPSLEVLWLDLILSLTSFYDGQNWLAKNSELVDILVDRAITNGSLPAMAILRNLSFHPGGRAKLLLLPNYLSMLRQSLKCGQNSRVNLALISIWALTANCHKAKVVVAKYGIPQLLEEVDHCDTELVQTVLSLVCFN